MGHRLTIAMNAWRARVDWSDSEPSDVALTIDVDSLEVLSGEGGLTPLSGPEKALARSNALKVLDAKKFPHIEFTASSIAKSKTGYRLDGTLQIHGTSRDCVIDLNVDDVGQSWRMSCESEVRHKDFGMKPYSMLMGSMKVADAVTVTFIAEQTRDA